VKQHRHAKQAVRRSTVVAFYLHGNDVPFMTSLNVQHPTLKDVFAVLPKSAKSDTCKWVVRQHRRVNLTKPALRYFCKVRDADFPAHTTPGSGGVFAQVFNMNEQLSLWNEKKVILRVLDHMK
jgi:hypothetical protein